MTFFLVRGNISLFAQQDMCMPKLTKRLVESITPHCEKVLVTWDNELKGFGVITRPGGRQTYCLQYRNKKRTLRRLKLGVHGQITTEDARSVAKKYFGDLSRGVDPLEEKKAQLGLRSVRDLASDYVDRYGKNKRPRSLQEDQKLLNNLILPALGKQEVMHLSRREIERFHSSLSNTPYQANRALALLSKMMSLAVSWEWCSKNPVRGLPRFPEEKRQRWLDKDETLRLWSALDQYKDRPSAYFFKLLLLTGARKNELLRATWSHFDLKKCVWLKPASLTKQKKPEYLPLSGTAVHVLHDLKSLSLKGEFLFPGQTVNQPLVNVQTLWKAVIKKANLPHVRIHDLRHTHASHLVSSVLSLSIVGKLLGHTQVSTTQRYAHLADAPLRDATNLLAHS